MAYQKWTEEDLYNLARQSPLTKLALSLNLDEKDWLDYAIRPLRETMRLTLKRSDSEWTKSKLQEMGAKPISWTKNDMAWEFNFPRGKPETDFQKRMLTILHDTGRVTRQEAASMIPVELMGLKNEKIVLDMCAAPGSKTTQIAERLADNCFVIANEPSSSRTNMLISNRARIGLDNILINQQDGRHIGRIPPPGYDAIFADVPCTGNATTRKNPKVWQKWKPRDGRSMFKLQLTIAERGARNLKPGGKLAYSTCSIDPIENEAVVAQLLRNCPWLELVSIDESNLPDLKLNQGLSEWEILDDDGFNVEITDELPPLPTLSIEHLAPSVRSNIDGESDKTREVWIESELVKCRRLYHMDNDTGGFFVAILRHKPEYTPEGVARAYITKRKNQGESQREVKIIKVEDSGKHAISPASREEIEEVMSGYNLKLKAKSFWKRGKRLNIAPQAVHDLLYEPKCPNKRGDYWQNNTFHPLKLLHVGMPCFVYNKGSWRTRQDAIATIEDSIDAACYDISREVLIALLNGEIIDAKEFFGQDHDKHGPLLLRCEIDGINSVVSTWIGQKISLMVNTLEKDVLRAKLQLPFEHEIEGVE